MLRRNECCSSVAAVLLVRAIILRWLVRVVPSSPYEIVPQLLLRPTKNPGCFLRLHANNEDVHSAHIKRCDIRAGLFQKGCHNLHRRVLSSQNERGFRKSLFLGRKNDHVGWPRAPGREVATHPDRLILLFLFAGLVGGKTTTLYSVRTRALLSAPEPCTPQV